MAEQGNRRSVRERLREREARAATAAHGAIPALITGGAGDDPAGVVTYTIVGATTGFTQLWLIVLATPMLAAATIMAGRVAMAARNGLAAIIERRYGRTVSLIVVTLLTVPNVATIAADTAGVAAVLGIVTGIRWEAFVPLILLLLALLLRRGYGKLKRALTGLTLVLLFYAVAAIMARPDWTAVAEATLLPTVGGNKAWLIAALGLLGTTISPYMLFWQASEEVEELDHGAVIHPTELDSGIWIGMIYSNSIAFFIIVAAGATIHGSDSPAIVTVADAARALGPLHGVGQAAFAIGIIAAGFLALPVLAASTAYAFAEVFGWRKGLGLKAATARGFNVVLGCSLGGGALISLLPNFHPATALYYSQVLDGILLPAILLILLVLSNDQRVVGATRNPSWVNWLAGLAVLAALAADFGALLT